MEDLWSQGGKAPSKEELESDARMERVTAAILARGTLYNAADVYEAFTQLSQLGAAARVETAKVGSPAFPHAGKPLCD